MTGDKPKRRAFHKGGDKPCITGPLAKLTFVGAVAWAMAEAVESGVPVSFQEEGGQHVVCFPNRRVEINGTDQTG